MFTGISQASVSGMSTMLLVHFMHSILSIVLRRRRVFACTRSSYVILIGVTLSSIIQDQMPVVTGMLMVSWKLTTLVVRRDGMFWEHCQEVLVVTCPLHILKGYGGTEVVILGNQSQYGGQYHALVLRH